MGGLMGGCYLIDEQIYSKMQITSVIFPPEAILRYDRLVLKNTMER